MYGDGLGWILAHGNLGSLDWSMYKTLLNTISLLGKVVK